MLSETRRQQIRNIFPGSEERQNGKSVLRTNQEKGQTGKSVLRWRLFLMVSVALFAIIATTVRVVPDATNGDTDPSVGVAADGTVYFGYEGADGHARIASSRDKGATWRPSQDVGALG